MALDKCRYYAFEVYPDSAPDDWIQQLRDSHGSYVVSPLHTPDDGKPHYHVVYRHSNPCSAEHVTKVIPGGIPANGHVEAVHAPRNYQRYLLHLDDPEKQQFEGSPRELLIVLNGFPLDLTRDFSKAELQDMKLKIDLIIRENNITEYCDLCDYLMDTDLDLYDYATNHTIHYTAIIRSRRGKVFN